MPASFALQTASRRFNASARHTVPRGKALLVFFSNTAPDIDFERIEEIETEAYETDFEIGEATNLIGNLKYGDLSITGSLEEAELTLYEVDIEAEVIDKLNISESKYSKFIVREIRNLKFNQSYEDETEIYQLGSFESQDTKYGKHDIEILTSNFELNGYEEDVEIKQINASVDQIILKGKYIDSSIDLQGSAFTLTSNTKYGDISYDEDSINIKKYIKDGDQLEIEAYSKTKSDAPITIDINGYEIELDIKG